MCQLALYFAALVEMKQLMACQGHEDYARSVLLCPEVRQPFGFGVRYNTAAHKYPFPVFRCEFSLHVAFRQL